MFWLFDELIMCTPSPEHTRNDLCARRVYKSPACKHAHDIATITDNVAWMLEAGVHNAAFECVYSPLAAAAHPGAG